MRARVLVAFGIAMPAVYVLTVLGASLLFPGYELFAQQPSRLGGPDAPYPLVYNFGMVATATAGVVAAVGLLLGFRSIKRGWSLQALGWLTGISLLAGSIGLGMAGLFPLPDPLHYGFGLTLAAALTPMLGAAALFCAGQARGAVLGLIAAFALIVGLVILRAGPLAPGLAMMASIALLCLAVRRRLAQDEP